MCCQHAGRFASFTLHPDYLRSLLDIVRAEGNPLGLFTDLTCGLYASRSPEPTITTAPAPAAIAKTKGSKPRPSPASGEAGAVSSTSGAGSSGGAVGAAGVVFSSSGTSGGVLGAAAVAKGVSADQADQSP